MNLPKTDPREHWALRYTLKAGGSVRISAGQKQMAKRLKEKGLVILRSKTDGIEMTLTDDGKKVAKQPKPPGGPGAPLQ